MKRQEPGPNAAERPKNNKRPKNDPLFGAGEMMSGMKRFKRKAEAAAHARKHGLCIVGYDISKKFHKAFITCTREELFQMVALQQMQYVHVSGLPGGWRNIYEGLLWERPCIPYFDLDAETRYNPGILKRIDDICLEFMKVTTALLKRLCPMNPAVQSIRCPNDWIVLDSSNRKKASRHLLLRKRGVEFGTLEEHAKFSAHLMQELRHEALVKKTEVGRMLYVSKQDKDKPVERCSIADWSVYSVFQLMRAFLCSKRGQRRPLVVSPSFPEHPSVLECFEKNGGPRSDPPTRRLFFDCLISNASPREQGIFLQWPKSFEKGGGGNTKTTTITITTTINIVSSSSSGGGTSPGSSSSSPGIVTEPRMKGADWRSHALIGILKSEPYLKEWMFGKASVPADFKICNTRNGRGDSTFVVIPLRTKFCPLKGGDHDKAGKVWVTVPSIGFMKFKCKVGTCQAKCDPRHKSVLLRCLNRSQIRKLWPDKT